MQVDEEECSVRKTKPVSSVKCSRNDCDTWEVNLLLAQDIPFLVKNGKNDTLTLPGMYLGSQSSNGIRFSQPHHLFNHIGRNPLGEGQVGSLGPQKQGFFPAE